MMTSLGSSEKPHPGESLVLHRNSYCCNPDSETFVVDLGRGEELGVQASIAAPSIVILTHDDTDHIGGWPKFAEFQARVASKIRELWVPAEWGYLARCVLNTRVGNRKSESVAQLTFETSQKMATCLEVSDMRHLWYEEKHIVLHPNGGQGERSGAYSTLAGISDTLASFEEVIIKTFMEIIECLELDTNKWLDQESDLPSAPSPHEAARRALKRWADISEILSWCGQNGVAVRFFSTRLAPTRKYSGNEPWKTSGLPGSLTITNALEVDPERLVITDPLKTAFFLIESTSQNRMALTPYLHGNCASDAMGIMVWSDSAGELAGVGAHWDLTPWAHIGAMTAPHHGSANESHDAIWCARKKISADRAREIPVVVSGTMNARFPHDAVGKLSNENRTCNRCKHVDRLSPGHLATVTLSEGKAQVYPRCG